MDSTSHRTLQHTYQKCIRTTDGDSTTHPFVWLSFNTLIGVQSEDIKTQLCLVTSYPGGSIIMHRTRPQLHGFIGHLTHPDGGINVFIITIKSSRSKKNSFLTYKYGYIE